VKALIFIALVVGSLVAGENAMSQAFSSGENLRHERVVLPPALQDRTKMAVVDTLMFVEASTAGVLIYYDDARTKLWIDCVELYNVEGKLLVVTWIDRFGVYQAAMDRGLLDPDHPSVDGVLVTVEVGTAL
jgi:hypothetical protein